MADAIVQCPTCRKAVAWITASIYKPFCSERCQLIDLGEWASGNRSIPSDSEHDDVTASDLDQDN
ncbi:MAG: DNA gyrase inhibitor YacG [Pseudomonadales bacterium]|jgi:endogenous inhibitor of DNA gyrase (YacG/DUF329 family)|nr:DNA gyrase inhibitor YacG [Pseudomonadales bacterium]MDA0760431.1 DNA gyrase inhibitor YacG [Pseudomonadota bacterium]MDA0957932.1 DNA gyrase inhibitor YacG [Pseudomonadota bacterium]MDA1207295.1 DNA gyrase inhibitor YacG [Pseudomonadota bacterium]